MSILVLFSTGATVLYARGTLLAVAVETPACFHSRTRRHSCSTPTAISSRSDAHIILLLSAVSVVRRWFLRARAPPQPPRVHDPNWRRILRYVLPPLQFLLQLSVATATNTSSVTTYTFAARTAAAATNAANAVARSRCRYSRFYRGSPSFARSFFVSRRGANGRSGLRR